MALWSSIIFVSIMCIFVTLINMGVDFLGVVRKLRGRGSNGSTDHD